VFSICNIESGDTFNVFPDKAIMRGTIRCYDDEIEKNMTETVKRVAEETAKAYDCRADVKIW
jgi:metal-dependent amidase/aminoacylase/carboxypeptidase family protein